MFERNRFDRIFDGIFSKWTNNFNYGDWEGQSYVSPDGTYSLTIMSKGFPPKDKNDQINMLEKKLNLAVEEQNFEDAAILRDKIKSLKENGEKIKELENKMQECIEKQDFEGAIEYRDKLNKLKK